LSFESLNLVAPILKAISSIGYKEATLIQQKAIPEVINKNHVLASAQTGTGKTAAFVLPILQHLHQNHKSTKGPRVLIVSPTRELANQITDSIKKYGRFLSINSVTITGGMSYKLQNKFLSKPLDILIATPGRLLDLVQQRKIKLRDIEIMVLDEADRMLDMGFVPDIRKIFNETSKEQQMLMFSATLDQSISKIAEEFLKNPVIIKIKQESTGHVNIEQSLYYVDTHSHKYKILIHLLESSDIKQAIIFTATKRQADKLSDQLYEINIKSSALHGDMSQGSRTKTINRFKRNEIKLLIATDLASRGIDVQNISHVINYDLPRMAEDYVHRIGRTGRANKQGLAISLVNLSDQEHLRKIEKFINFKIEKKVVPGLEAQLNELTEVKRKKGRSGKKRPFIKSRKPSNNTNNAKKRLKRKFPTNPA
jgi:ATP-dependent RNA helicase RhlE